MIVIMGGLIKVFCQNHQKIYWKIMKVMMPTMMKINTTTRKKKPTKGEREGEKEEGEGEEGLDKDNQDDEVMIKLMEKIENMISR